MQISIRLRIFATAITIFNSAIVFAESNPKNLLVNAPELALAEQAYVNGQYGDALVLWQKYSEQGNDKALTRLGFLYQEGLGVEKNYEKALQLWHRAAAAGNPEAMHLIAWMYRNGFGIQKSNDEAVRWWKRSASKGFAKANHNLAIMYEDGEGVEKNHQEALRLYKLASDAGVLESTYRLAVLYRDGDLGEIQQHSKANELFEKAANLGHAESQNALANQYFNGYGYTKDLQKALHWHTKAANQNLVESIHYLGYAHFMGFGVPRNLDAAEKHWEAAASMGYRESMYALHTLNMRSNLSAYPVNPPFDPKKMSLPGYYEMVAAKVFPGRKTNREKGLYWEQKYREADLGYKFISQKNKQPFSNIVTDCDRYASPETDVKRLTSAVFKIADLNATIGICRNNLAKDPDNPRLKTYLARALWAANGKTDEVRDLLREADQDGYAEASYRLYMFYWPSEKDVEYDKKRLAVINLYRALNLGHIAAAVTIANIKFNNPDLYKQIINHVEWGEYTVDTHHNLFDRLYEVTRTNPDSKYKTMADSFVKHYYPNGYEPRRDHWVTNGDGTKSTSSSYKYAGAYREVVKDTSIYPFSSVGGLYAVIKAPDGTITVGMCSASLVGNRRTLATAAHCLQGSEASSRLVALYYFPERRPNYIAHQLPNNPSILIPARVWKAGEFPNTGGEKLPPINQNDDWAILDLANPVSNDVIPFMPANDESLEDYKKGSLGNSAPETIGFPADIEGGEKLVWSRGCSFWVKAKVTFSDTYVTDTDCPSYYGSSGGAILLQSKALNKRVFFGVLSGGNNSNTRIVVSFDMIKEIKRKIAIDGDEYK